MHRHFKVKSAPARVTQTDSGYRITGMAWGPAPIAAVEVKIDGGAWTKATLSEVDKSPPVARAPLHRYATLA